MPTIPHRTNLTFTSNRSPTIFHFVVLYHHSTRTNQSVYQSFLNVFQFSLFSFVTSLRCFFATENECIRLFVLICLLCSSYIQLDLRAECRGYQNFIFCLSKSFHIFRGVLKSIHHHVYRFYPVNDHF